MNNLSRSSFTSESARGALPSLPGRRTSAGSGRRTSVSFAAAAFLAGGATPLPSDATAGRPSLNAPQAYTSSLPQSFAPSSSASSAVDTRGTRGSGSSQQQHRRPSARPSGAAGKRSRRARNGSVIPMQFADALRAAQCAPSSTFAAPRYKATDIAERMSHIMRLSSARISTPPVQKEANGDEEASSSYVPSTWESNRRLDPGQWEVSEIILRDEAGVVSLLGESQCILERTFGAIGQGVLPVDSQCERFSYGLGMARAAGWSGLVKSVSNPKHSQWWFGWQDTMRGTAVNAVHEAQRWLGGGSGVSPASDSDSDGHDVHFARGFGARRSSFALPSGGGVAPSRTPPRGAGPAGGHLAQTRTLWARWPCCCRKRRTALFRLGRSTPRPTDPPPSPLPQPFTAHMLQITPQTSRNYCILGACMRWKSCSGGCGTPASPALLRRGVGGAATWRVCSHLLSCQCTVCSHCLVRPLPAGPGGAAPSPLACQSSHCDQLTQTH